MSTGARAASLSRCESRQVPSALACAGAAPRSPSGSLGAVMSSHDVERALVQSLIGIADDRFNETIAAMQTDLDRLRDDWASGYAESRQAHEDRMAAMRIEDRQYLQALSADDGTPSPERPGAVGASVPVGHRLQDHHPDPREAELARARAIKAMSMAEYAQERQRLIRADPGTF